jgi:hypothetical protein
MLDPQHDPDNVTRILFQDFPGWMSASFYVVAILVIAILSYRCYIQIRKKPRGKPVSVGNLWRGIVAMVGALF